VKPAAVVALAVDAAIDMVRGRIRQETERIVLSAGGVGLVAFKCHIFVWRLRAPRVGGTS
jgi:hypothetical protein